MAMFNVFTKVPGLGLAKCKGLVLAFYTVCFLGYIALGGLIFLLIEGNEEDMLEKKLQIARANVIEKFPCMTDEALNDFLIEVSSFRIRGLRTPNSTSAEKWSYSQAVFFSVTLLTTIGYGHVAPVTQIGKITCMMYTGLGIPCALLLLAAYVQRLMSVAKALQKALTFCLGQIFKPLIIRVCHLALITVLIGLLFFFLPAWLFSYLEEGWTYIDALYFCFISLTTVGLGDYVPAENPIQPYQAAYRFGVTFYILAGVTAMMFLMSLTAEFQQSQQDDDTRPLDPNHPSYGTIVIEKTTLINTSEQNRTSLP